MGGADVTVVLNFDPGAVLAPSVLEVASAPCATDCARKWVAVGNLVGNIQGTILIRGLEPQGEKS